MKFLFALIIVACCLLCSLITAGANTNTSPSPRPSPNPSSHTSTAAASRTPAAGEQATNWFGKDGPVDDGRVYSLKEPAKN